MNALLSFLYSVLLNDCPSAPETVGLDPHLGFLHAVRPGHPALALDLLEEFRSVIVDASPAHLSGCGLKYTPFLKWDVPSDNASYLEEALAVREAFIRDEITLGL
jgi:CRISPR-associated endonuclease Cas1